MAHLRLVVSPLFFLLVLLLCISNNAITAASHQIDENDRNDIEADNSWALFQERLSTSRHRLLKDKGPPAPGEDTQHGMMIDAGSQGTRIHVYEFDARFLHTKKDVEEVVIGKRLSFPTTDTRWTNRLKPGLDAFAFQEDMPNQVRAYLEPLLSFAKQVLEEKKDDWRKYPIYLKATGGMRALPVPYRLKVMAAVREIFSDKDFNPFYFEEEHARVISGEEEAIYGWAAVNFVKGSLLQNSRGSGSVLNPKLTYGVLEMGGASTQIGFFEPNGDVMADLFKLQIGASKHWNVYCHSFLYFGINGAFERMNARLYMESNNGTNSGGYVYNPCLPGGSDFLVSSRVHMNRDHTLLPLSSPNDSSVLEASLYPMYLANDDTHGNPERCEHYVNLLLRREANSWCDFAHDRDCSFAGVYQPPLPIGSEAFGEFIATSNFHSVWEFLGLEERPRLSKVRDGARRICSMSFAELVAYSFQLPNPIKDVDDIKQMCFRATFAWIFLINGIGFPEDYKVIAVDVINGQKLGWALGSMLYEINTLPWEFGEKPKNLVPDILGMIGLSDENGEAPHVVLLSFLLGAALAALGLSFGKERRRRTRRLRLDDCDSELAGLARSSLTRDYGSTTHS